MTGKGTAACSIGAAAVLIACEDGFRPVDGDIAFGRNLPCYPSDLIARCASHNGNVAGMQGHMTALDTFRRQCPKGCHVLRKAHGNADFTQFTGA